MKGLALVAVVALIVVGVLIGTGYGPLLIGNNAPTPTSVKVFDAGITSPLRAVSIQNNPTSWAFAPGQKAEPTGFSVMLGSGESASGTLVYSINCGGTITSGSQLFNQIPVSSPINQYTWWTFTAGFTIDNPDFTVGQTCTLTVQTVARSVAWGFEGGREQGKPTLYIWGEPLAEPPATPPTQPTQPEDQDPPGTNDTDDDEDRTIPGLEDTALFLLVGGLAVLFVAVQRRKR